MKTDINKEPSNKTIFTWNIFGSIANSALSVLILVIVARGLDIRSSDIFSIAWSISQMMATIGTFQVRTYQATDVKEKYKFGQYLIFRFVTILIMIFASAGYIAINGFDLYKSFIVILLCLFRGVESLMDVYEGYFQQKERLDLVGKASTYRVLIALITFYLATKFTENLAFSSVILLLSYVASFILFDLKYAHCVNKFDLKEKWDKNNKWIYNLVRECFPIFVNSFLMMMITNAPKLMIDKEITNGHLADGAQTIFNILFMPASVLTLVYIVFRPLMTKMAIEWNERRIKEFLKIIYLMLFCLAGMAVVFLGAGYLFGTQVLSGLYSISLTDYRFSLTVIILGGCFCTFSYVFDNALIVIRKQYLLFFSYLISCIYMKVIVSYFVSSYGIFGAVFSYMTSMLLFLMITIVIFVFCMKKGKRSINSD